MEVINIFGGPGVGKSFVMATVYSILSSMGFRVEQAPEVAKDIVWDGDFDRFKDQLAILAEQNHRLRRLDHKVDFVVTDGPLLIQSYYWKHHLPPTYMGGLFDQLINEAFDGYQNSNFFLHRSIKYDTIGRMQTEQEARTSDTDIRNLLVNRTFTDLLTINTAPQQVVEEILKCSQR